MAKKINKLKRATIELVRNPAGDVLDVAAIPTGTIRRTSDGNVMQIIGGRPVAEVRPDHYVSIDAETAIRLAKLAVVNTLTPGLQCENVMEYLNTALRIVRATRES